MADIRRAEARDLPGIRKLLFQVNQLHADGRPDLFKSGGIKYTDDALRLIITDDGAFAHQLLSPRSHVDKVYLADVEGIMTGEDAARIAQGIDIGEEKPAMPARLEILETDEIQGTCRIRLTLQEGKYHQVKRMVAACGKEVIYLKRVRMGVLELPEDLPAGQWRQISREDVLGV